MSWTNYYKITVGMQNIQDVFATCEQSFFITSLICMTVPFSHFYEAYIQ